MSSVETVSETPLPSNVSPPPEVISYENQSGLIAIIAGFALGMIVLSAFMKLYARKYFRNFRHDDLTFTLAVVSSEQIPVYYSYFRQILAIAQSSVVFYEIRDGFGVVFAIISEDHRKSLQKAGLAADLLYIGILFLSKSCCALFFLWLAPGHRQKTLAWLLVGASAVWLVTGMFIEGFRCSLGDEWHLYRQQCMAFVSSKRLKD